MMGHRVNVIIDDETWELVEAIPKGERSRAINTALTEWGYTSTPSLGRRSAVAQMDALRARVAPVSTDDIVSWLREDRERNV